MTETTYNAATSAANKTATDAPRLSPVPQYMYEVYDWAYVNPAWVRWLDRNIVVKTLLFGNDQRLMRAYLAKLKPGMRVWQVAHVYGDLVRRAAERCGPEGSFHLTDVTPIQVAHGVRKLADLPWAKVTRADAASYTGNESHDLICSFFLLHEVPENWKRAIVNNMLAQLPDRGEALFVDYHKPRWWQPVGYILRAVNRLLEPFAFALWDREISTYADDSEAYTWEKRTIFGGVYQIVSARRKTAG